MNESAMLLSLIGDFSGDCPAEVPLVESDVDYVKVCARIRERPPTEIWVRMGVHLAWLTAFVELMGLEAIQEEKTPRVLLAEAMGCTIPDWLTDAQIMEEGLLAEVGEGGKADRFVSAMLAKEISPLFEEPDLSPEILSGILTAILEDGVVERFAAKPFLRRCLEDQCAFWAAQDNDAWVAYACERLPRAAQELHRDLTFHALLSRYPSALREYKLSAQTLVALKDLDPEALLEGAKHSDALSESESLLRTEAANVVEEIKSAADLRKLLKCFTGQLRVEFEMALEVLDSGRIALESDLLKEVRDCFDAGGVVPRTKLEALSLRIPPPLPEIRGGGFDTWPDWERWSLHEYLPYRAWQQATGTFLPELEKMVEYFSAWVVEQYPSLHADVDISLIHALKKLEKSFQSEELSVLLVVDCLSEFFRADLQARFGEMGFHLHQARHACAPLPSCTEISKPLLLSGSHEIKGSDYESILKKRAADRWPGKKVRYFGGNISALRVWEGSDGCNFLVVNDLTVDELMHADVEAKGSTHAEEVNRHFTRLANAVRELVENWKGDASKVGVHVVTDHGATRILEAESESVDSTLAGKLFPNEKYRFARMSQEEADSLPRSLWSLGHAFHSPFVEQDAKWFIPRGHHTVRNAKQRGFVHGGATPEELLVPVMTFRPVAVAWKAPECRPEGLRLNAAGEALFYLRRLQPIRLEVRNPNAVDIEIARVDVLSAGAEIRQSVLTSVAPQGKAEVRMELMFSDAAMMESELVLQLAWSIQGQREVREIRIPARVQSATGGGFSLKDL